MGESARLGKDIRFVCGYINVPLPNWNWSSYVENAGRGLIFLKTLGQPILFINTYEAAVNLYEKHGSVTSSRPSIPLSMMWASRRFLILRLPIMLLPFREGWEWTLTLVPYGARMKRQREMIHRSFSSSSVLQFVPIQTQYVNRMLLRIIEDPDDLLQHIRRYSKYYNVDFQSSSLTWLV